MLLLTACVEPKGMSFTALQSRDTRRLQYVTALKWYLTHTKLNIVIVENTLNNYVSEFQSYIRSGRLEFITFDGNNYNHELGKGYGEAQIIRKAIECSRLIASCDLIIKITGRIVIENINLIARLSTCPMTLYGKKVIYNDKNAIESIIFVAPKSFIANYFLDSASTINDSTGYYFEHLLYDKAQSWKHDGNNVSEFPVPIRINGISGTTGKTYYRLTNYEYYRALLKFILT